MAFHEQIVSVDGLDIQSHTRIPTWKAMNLGLWNIWKTRFTVYQKHWNTCIIIELETKRCFFIKLLKKKNIWPRV